MTSPAQFVALDRLTDCAPGLLQMTTVVKATTPGEWTELRKGRGYLMWLQPPETDVSQTGGVHYKSF
jgi:hypothetical protein